MLLQATLCSAQTGNTIKLRDSLTARERNRPLPMKGARATHHLLVPVRCAPQRVTTLSRWALATIVCVVYIINAINSFLSSVNSRSRSEERRTIGAWPRPDDGQAPRPTSDHQASDFNGEGLQDRERNATGIDERLTGHLSLQWG